MSNSERRPSYRGALGLIYAGFGYVLFGTLSAGAVAAEVSATVNSKLEGVHTPLSRFDKAPPQLVEAPPQPTHQAERLAAGIASVVIGGLMIREGHGQVFSYTPPAPQPGPLPLRPAVPEQPVRRPEEQYES
jgi:hypothetical protein